MAHETDGNWDSNLYNTGSLVKANEKEQVKNKYKFVDDHIEIEANGSIINIDFNNAIEYFNSIENANLVESSENKQEVLYVLNESILNAYNSIINGTSYLSNSMTIKTNYSKKLTKLFDKIKEEASKRCVIKIKEKSKNKTLNDVEIYINSNNTFVKTTSEIIANKETTKNIKQYYSNFINSYDKEHKFKQYYFDNQVKNGSNYTCNFYEKIDDYINKKSYIQFDGGDNTDASFNWFEFDLLSANLAARELCTNNEHYTLRDIGFIPSEDTFEKWIKELNKNLSSVNLQINDAYVDQVKHLLEGKLYITQNGYNIKSKSGTEGNALDKIFEDIKKGGEFKSAFNSYLNKKGSSEYKNKNFDIGGDVLKNNNFFGVEISQTNLGKISNLFSYISDALIKCFEGLKTAEANNAENIMNYFRTYSNTIENLSGRGKQSFESFLDVDNYYDFYSSMNPTVTLKFRYKENGRIKECKINNINYSFIKSMKMTDNGAKVFEIKLYDRDFNTPIYEYNSSKHEFDKKTNYGSLDVVLAKTLNINSEKKSDADEASETKTKKYKIGSSNFGDLLGFETGEGTEANLIIQYGFSDYDGGAPASILNGVKIEDHYANVGKTRYLAEDIPAKENNGVTIKRRNARWWNTSIEESSVDNKTIMDRANSPNPTTSNTPVFYTIITGYETKFTEGGIYYSIKAIEFTSARLNNYKIYQRYTNLVGKPTEVLYSVMKIINGLFRDKIKVYVDEELAQEGGIYEETEEINEENEDGEAVIGTKVKEISVSLGTKDALSMYIDSGAGQEKITTDFEIIKKSKAKMYKSVKTLLNDLCAAMPAKLDENISTEDRYIEDEDGNSKKVNEAYKSYRRFTYTVYNEKETPTIIFHYQRPQKFKYIRKYNWGPANAITSVIKSVDIKTENEYSLLSSMTVINYEPGTKKPIKEIITRDGCYLKDSKLETRIGNKADYIYSPGSGGAEQEIAMSYAQCLYSGTITILGDPFYNFDKFVIPYTYPIYLDFKVPRSEIDIYNQYSNNLKNYKDQAVSKTKQGYSHFMSGFYVVTSIEQNISEAGFITTLGVMSYPNIIKDIL